MITRKYPPVQGGMEQYSLGLYRSWAEREDVRLIANPDGNRALPQFFAKAAWAILCRLPEFDHIHLADGVLSALIPLVRQRSPRVGVSITIHGLDITFERYGYQSLFPRLVSSADRIVCVSSHTARACLERGIPASKTVVIPNGIELGRLPKNQRHTRANIERKYSFSLDGHVLFSVGRLVRRKGHAWFLRRYWRELDSRFRFVIAGEGPERPAIMAAIDELGARARVHLIGAIEDDERAFWLDTARAYVMPNIAVPNDPEGFGISCLEAAAHRLPVFTTGIEGIADQMGYCYPLDALALPMLPVRSRAEWDELHARIDWRYVIDSYIDAV